MHDLRKSLDPRMIGEMILARKWWLIVPLLVTIGTSIYIIENMDEVYRVSTSLLYEARSPLTRQIEGKLLPDAQQLGRARPQEAEAKANVLRLKILSQPFLTEIGRDLGLMDQEWRYQMAEERKAETGDPTPIDKMVEESVAGWLGGMITINISGGNIYRITTEGTNLRLIFDLANNITEKISEVIQGDEIDRIDAASRFTKQQVAIYRSRSAQAKASLQTFLIKQPAPGSEGSRPVDVDQRAAARLAEETGFEIRRLSEALEEARSTLSNSYALSLASFMAELPNALILLEEQLKSLEKQLGYLLLERSWSDPTVITQNRRIGETRIEMTSLVRQHVAASLASRSSTVRDLVANGARDQILLRTLDIRRNTLAEQSVGAVGEGGAEYLRNEEELRYLQEQVRINEDLLQSFLNHAAAAQITEAIEKDEQIQRVRILTPAKWAAKPVLPNKPQNYAVAILLGIALGSGFMILREYLDTSIRDVHEAEELMGAPILGTIPRIDFSYMPAHRGGVRKSLIFTVLGVIVLGAAFGYYFYFMDHEPVSKGEAEPTAWVGSQADQNRRLG